MFSYDSKGRRLQRASDDFHEDRRSGGQTGYMQTGEINYDSIVGIRNPKNDCFMIAALQCLFCVPEFMQFFIDKNYRDEHDRIPKNFWNERKSKKVMKIVGYKSCDAMSKFLSDAAYRHRDIIKASYIRALFMEELPRGEQHDAHEFIINLFSRLQDEQTPRFAKFNSEEYKSGTEAWQGY